MNDIKKTLLILKARLPEVILLVGLNVLVVLSSLLFREENSEPVMTYSLFSIIISLLFTIGLINLRLGFLRTVYLEEEKQQLPSVLLKTGKHFFWRIVYLGLLYVIVYLALAWFIFSITKQVIPISKGFFETAPWVRQLFFILAMLTLVKPFLLIPAMIIVLDCGIFQSFRLLRQCHLRDSKPLVMLFLVQMAFTFLWSFLPISGDKVVMSEYVFISAGSIIGYFLSLAIAISAIRFVGSLNLIYDAGIEPLMPKN